MKLSSLLFDAGTDANLIEFNMRIRVKPSNDRSNSWYFGLSCV